MANPRDGTDHTNRESVAVKKSKMEVPNHARNANTIENPWWFKPPFRCFPMSTAALSWLFCVGSKKLSREDDRLR